MDLRDEHGKALETRTNYYRLTDSGRTNGLGFLGSDINSYNEYGMTPVQVALQAGDKEELEQILAMPGVDASKPSRSGKASVYYSYLFQATHQGSNPFEGYTAKNEEGLLIDKRADELRQLLQATRPTAPKAQPVTAP
jgi:hypothetical protein